VDFDTSVKLKIYDLVATTATMPTSEDIAQSLGTSVGEVQAAFQRLHQKRLLVPEPGDPNRIRMAPPFSGIETPFLVKAGGKSYDANCSWDALGVPAALHQDAVIEATDAHTGDSMRLEIKGGQPVAYDCAVHFAVPAAKWWDDIIYT
jgi:DNA-binding transcriptional MocR family regulator